MSNYTSTTENRSPQLSGFEGRLLEIERNQDLFNEVLRTVIPEILSWSIDQHETGQYFLKFSSSEKSHSSEGVGEGVISAFVIVAALFDSSAKDVIVIDEPELSLHPQIQRRLMALIESYTSDRQIIIATHSPYFITKSAIEGGISICRCWDRDGTISLSHISTKCSSSSLKILSSNNINNPHIFGLDAREFLFFEDGVLVFEGQEDVVLWPKVAHHFGRTPGQMYGWGAGGAENIKNVLETLRCLGFKKVAAIFDADKKSEATRVQCDFPEYTVLVIPADDIRTKPAVKAREEKIGILDSNLAVRPEHEEACRVIVEKLSSALS